MFKSKATTQKKSKKKSNKVAIGSGWMKKGKDGNEFMSITFKGNYEKDEFDVILRSKSDGTEMNLADTGGIIFANGFKEQENQPDMVIMAYLPDEE